MDHNKEDTKKASKKDQETLKNFGRITADVDKAISELEAKLSTLPTIDDKGGSECPFAEDLYAQAEEAEENLTRLLPILQGFISALDHEVSRCKNNLDLIRSGASNLANPEAKRRMEAAERTQKQEYLKAVENRKTADYLLKRANVVLKRAKSKKYPGRKPERQSPFTKTSAEASDADRDEGRQPLEKELEGVLSVGSVQ